MVGRGVTSRLTRNLGPAPDRGLAAAISTDDGDDANSAVGMRARRQRVHVHGIATALRPAGRGITAVKREVDEIDNALDVQPDRRPTIELVFEPAHRVAEQKSNFIDAQTVPGPPSIER
jgi:hypothetical protein